MDQKAHLEVKDSVLQLEESKNQSEEREQILRNQLSVSQQERSQLEGRIRELESQLLNGTSDDNTKNVVQNYQVQVDDLKAKLLKALDDVESLGKLREKLEAQKSQVESDLLAAVNEK